MVDNQPSTDPVPDTDRSSRKQDYEKQKGKDGKSGRHKRTKKHKDQKQHYQPCEPKFEGSNKSLKGFIFDTVKKGRGTKFKNTLEEIARYFGDKHPQFGPIISNAIKYLRPPDLPMPTQTDYTPNGTFLFHEALKIYVRTKNDIQMGIKSAYNLIWGQCTESMRTKIKMGETFLTYSTLSNTITLLLAIRAEMIGFQKKFYTPHSVHNIMREFYTFYQGKKSNRKYYDDFNVLTETMNTSGVMVGEHQVIYNKAVTEITGITSAATLQEARTKAKQQYLATAYLLGCDRSRYGLLVQSIENEFARTKFGHSIIGMYPESVSDALNYLKSYKSNPKYLQQAIGTEKLHSSETAFTQRSGTKDYHDSGSESEYESTKKSFAVQDTKRSKPERKVVCNRCGQDGHTSPNCNVTQEIVDAFCESKKDNKGVTHLTNSIKDCHIEDDVDVRNFDDDQEFTYRSFIVKHTESPTKDGSTIVLAGKGKAKAKQKPKYPIPKSWVLLDNQSTCDIFFNANLLQNIRQVEGSMTFNTQAGSSKTNWIGDFPRYSTVWYDKNGIANILSLARMKKKYRVTFDSENSN